jgi:hypothetical protein
MNKQAKAHLSDVSDYSAYVRELSIFTRTENEVRLRIKWSPIEATVEMKLILPQE